MTVNLSASTYEMAQAVFDDAADVDKFICGTIQQIFELGTDKAIRIFSEQAKFANAQLAIAKELEERIDDIV